MRARRATDARQARAKRAPGAPQARARRAPGAPQARPRRAPGARQARLGGGPQARARRAWTRLISVLANVYFGIRFSYMIYFMYEGLPTDCLFF